MDKFDLRDAPNRRVQRAMEKENKKIREAAKRERNETVRVSQLSYIVRLFSITFLFVATGGICEEERQENGSI